MICTIFDSHYNNTIHDDQRKTIGKLRRARYMNTEYDIPYARNERAFTLYIFKPRIIMGFCT